MRPETQQLCDLIRQRAGSRAGAIVDGDNSRFRVRIGTSRLTVSEVGNTNPAIITVNVGSTISMQEIDDPALLPPPTSSRYQARLGDPTIWQDIVEGDELNADELSTAALATLDQYVANG